MHFESLKNLDEEVLKTLVGVLDGVLGTLEDLVDHKVPSTTSDVYTTTSSSS